MLGFLKKKKAAASQPEAEFNPLDAASVIDYIKQQKPGITDEELVDAFSKLAAPADDLDHLDEDGELPWGWHTANKDFTDEVQKKWREILNYWIESRKAPSAEQYAPLKALVDYLEDTQKLCQQKGECFVYWFDGCIADQNYIDKRKAELEHLLK